MSWQPAYFDSDDTNVVQDTQDTKPHDDLQMQLEDSPPDDSTILAPSIKVVGCIPRGTTIAYAYAHFHCRRCATANRGIQLILSNTRRSATTTHHADQAGTVNPDEASAPPPVVREGIRIISQLLPLLTATTNRGTNLILSSNIRKKEYTRLTTQITRVP